MDFVEDQPRAGDARLALVVEDGERGAVDGRLDVGVGEHDVGALAAQLELDALHVARRQLHDPTCPTAVEPVNAILRTSAMRRQVLARPRGPGPGTMLTTPGGTPASVHQLRQPQ